MIRIELRIDENITRKQIIAFYKITEGYRIEPDFDDHGDLCGMVAVDNG